MYRPWAMIASIGLNGEMLPSPASLRPIWAQVAGMNWLRPWAPPVCSPAMVAEWALGFQLDSCSICAASSEAGICGHSAPARSSHGTHA